MKLPELNAQATELDEQLEDFLSILDIQELTPEQEKANIEHFQSRYFANQQLLKVKANAWCWAITRMLASVDYLRSQARRFDKMAAALETRAKSMREYLLYTVEQQDGKLETPHFKLSVRTTAPKVEWNETYVGDIPSKYLKPMSVEQMCQIAEVKKALSDGEELPFARLGQKGKALYGLK